MCKGDGCKVVQDVGIKFDNNKDRYELIPEEAMTGIAQVLTFGAEKYGDRNWELGLSYSRVFGATLRHLYAWWRGQNKDPETGLSHLYHAGCCVSMLIAYTDRHMDSFDDRVTAEERGADKVDESVQ